MKAEYKLKYKVIAFLTSQLFKYDLVMMSV